MKYKALTAALTILTLVGCGGGGGGNGLTEPEGTSTGPLPPTTDGTDSSDGNSGGLDGSSGGLDGSSDGGNGGNIADSLSNGPSLNQISSQWVCRFGEAAYGVAFFDNGTGAFAQGDTQATIDRWSVSGSTVTWSLEGGDQVLEYLNVSFPNQNEFNSTFVIDGQSAGAQNCERQSLGGSDGGSDGGTDGGSGGNIADSLSNGPSLSQIDNQWVCTFGESSYGAAFFDDGTGAFAQGETQATIDRWSVSGTTVTWSLEGGDQVLEYRNVSFPSQNEFNSTFVIDGQSAGAQNCERINLG